MFETMKANSFQIKKALNGLEYIRVLNLIIAILDKN